MQRDTGAAGAGLEQETPCGPQREDGHDALGPAAGEPVAMPAGAVLAAAVEVEPEIVVADSIVLRQRVAGGHQRWVGCLRELAVLGGQPWLEEALTEDPPVVRLPGHRVGEPLEQLVGAGEPARKHLDPRPGVERGAPAGPEGGINGRLAATGEEVRLPGDVHDPLKHRPDHHVKRLGSRLDVAGRPGATSRRSEITSGRSDRGSSPWSRPRRSPRRTSPGHRSLRRPRPGPGAGSSTRRRGRRACRST